MVLKLLDALTLKENANRRLFLRKYKDRKKFSTCPSKRQASCEDVKPTEGNSDSMTVLKIITSMDRADINLFQNAAGRTSDDLMTGFRFVLHNLDH